MEVHKETKTYFHTKILEITDFSDKISHTPHHEIIHSPRGLWV